MTKVDSSPAPVQVLLIDDDDNVFPLIKRLLSKVAGRQFQIDWIGSYEAGLEAIKRNRHQICLLDYRLGMRSGLDLLREAVASGTEMPIIILTGADNPVVDQEAAASGASDYVLKDKLDSSMLERSIRYSIQHYATMRDLKKSNERFRLLFERSMDALLISDDEGHFLEINGAACKLFGFSREEFLRRKTADLLLRDTTGLFEHFGDQPFGELAFRRSDGQQRLAEFSACRFAHNLNLCILRDITDRRELEKEIQEISEREQRRLGEDLHDGLGQTLTGISFITKVLQQKLAAKGIDEARDAANLVNLMNQALTQTRELARGLCPAVLDRNDLHAALDHLSSNLEKYFGVAAQVKCDSDIEIRDNAVAVHLYRIAQEASTNAVKHGRAKRIELSFARSNGSTVLQVKDDGVGFSPGSQSKGMGLRVMHHRARMIGASIEIAAAKGGGTLVTCRIEEPVTTSRRQSGGRKKSMPAVGAGRS